MLSIFFLSKEECSDSYYYSLLESYLVTGRIFGKLAKDQFCNCSNQFGKSLEKPNHSSKKLLPRCSNKCNSLQILSLAI